MKKLIFSFASLAVVLAACQKNDIEEPQTVAGEPFSFEAQIASTKTTLEIDGTTYKVIWDADDVLSVKANYASASSQTYQFTKGDGNTFTCNNVQNPSQITSLEVYYQASEDASVTIGSQTQTGSGLTSHIDGPLYGYTTVSNLEQAVAVEMNHVSTVFEINVTNASSGAVNVTKVEVSNDANQPMSGTFTVNAQTGELTGTSTYASAVLDVTGTSIAAGETGKFYVMSAPFSLSQGANITVKVTAEGAAGEMVKTISKDISFKAGSVNHIYNVSTTTPEDMKFTVTAASASEITGYEAAWTDGDAINIFDGSLSSKFSYSSDKFAGKAISANGYYALYPYDEKASMTEGTISTTIPAAQTGEMSRLAQVGYVADGTISMKNITGMIKVNLQEDNVTKITISGNNGEIIAGAVTISGINSGTPTVTAASSDNGGSASVTIGDGSKVLEKKEYYVNVLPAVLSSGYTVTVTYKDDTSTYQGYYDVWSQGLTYNGDMQKYTITRGVCEFPFKDSASLSLTAGECQDLGAFSATLVYYDDAVPATIGGKTLENSSWDADNNQNNTWDAASTENPYSGNNCIKWTMTNQYGEIIFQTNNPTGDSRGALDLGEYRNAHFALEFAFKAETGTKCYVRFMQWLVNYECLRNMYDISKYATGKWELVQIPLDEMYLSNYVWNIGTSSRYYLSDTDLVGNTFYKNYPFAWNYIYRLNFAPNIDVNDTDNLGKTVYIDEIRIKKVIFSDQAIK